MENSDCTPKPVFPKPALSGFNAFTPKDVLLTPKLPALTLFLLKTISLSSSSEASKTENWLALDPAAPICSGALRELRLGIGRFSVRNHTSANRTHYAVKCFDLIPSRASNINARFNSEVGAGIKKISAAVLGARLIVVNYQ